MAGTRGLTWGVMVETDVREPAGGGHPGSSGSDGRPGRRWLLVALPLLLLLIQAAWVRQSLVEADRLSPVSVGDTDSYVRLSRLATIDGKLTVYPKISVEQALEICRSA